MSGNSCASALQTAPIVSDLRGASASSATGSGGRSSPSGSSSAMRLPGEVGQLVLADLQLVAVLELVGVDAPPVDVGAVERAGVVQEPAAGAVHQDRVVARDGHVVEEDLGIGVAADRHALAVERERLARAPAAGADD